MTITNVYYCCVFSDTGVTPWMVFEYMAYGDLAELLRKNAPKWGSPQGSPLDMVSLLSYTEAKRDQ